jgi:uncharacterized membrane protein YphA (DoxX/SURF4 family)
MESSFFSFPFLGQLMATAFTAILFLQSGLDKVLNYKGNEAYLKSVFQNSPLRNTVGLLMPFITLLEVSSGLLSLLGLFFLLQAATIWAFGAQVLSAFTLLCLFAGQRIAKDYAGAAGLVPYFILTLLGMSICR